MFTLRSLAVLLVVALQAVLLVSSTSALALRDSAAFVVPSVSGKSCMPLSMGSVVNMPSPSTGVCGGPLVGTGKQKKQQMKVIEEKRKVAKAAKEAAKAAKEAEGN